MFPIVYVFTPVDSPDSSRQRPLIEIVVVFPNLNSDNHIDKSEANPAISCQMSVPGVHQRTHQSVGSQSAPTHSVTTNSDSEQTTEDGTKSSVWEQVTTQITGDEGAGVAFSLLIHAIVLALMAIPIINELEIEEEFTTLVDNAADDDMQFNAPIDTSSPVPDPAQASDQLQAQLLDPLATDKKLIPEIADANASSLDNDSNGTGASDNAQGARIAEPKNAIKAGNFSVWYWPIIGTMQGTEIKHGIPGDAPRVRQHYSIVIRIKVPANRTFVRLNDFSGNVVGTDGYTQKIPDDAWFTRRNGEMVKARPSHRIPVIDGTAEIMIRVPGALYAQVRDTIDVRSRTLDDEQKVELIFEARD